MNPESHRSHSTSHSRLYECLASTLPSESSTVTALTTPAQRHKYPEVNCDSLCPPPAQGSLFPRKLTADCAWPSSSRQAVLCTWSRKGRLENTGKFLAHLTAMKSRRADVSWMPSRLQGDAGNSGSLLVTSIFSSAMKEGGSHLSGCSLEAGCEDPCPLPSHLPSSGSSLAHVSAVMRLAIKWWPMALDADTDVGPRELGPARAGEATTGSGPDSLPVSMPSRWT